jgi:hypothetical protein
MSTVRQFPRITVWVPANFWSDHEDRCPCNNEATDMATEIRKAGRRVLIEGNAKQLETLRSDAEYYCGRDGPDECPPGLIRSAKATLAAVEAATRDGFPVKATHGGAGRGQGRKPIAEGVESVIVNVRATPAQREKFHKLGGSEWFRRTLNRAKLPEGV